MTTGTQPRDEASILRWPANPESPDAGELDPQQYSAALTAHQLFVSMANLEPGAAPHPSELDSFLPRLDARRRNHTVLIDGTRGSGKTCVMLRLLHDWSDKLRGKALPKELAATKIEDGVAIIPVGLLDLESVPKTAKLATRLAGMFERVVGAMERRGAAQSASQAPWAALDGDDLPSRIGWRKFVKAAALEWDQSLERRRANIDPEAYAVEVEQAEREGSNARDCFRGFVDKLVSDWKGWRPQEGRPFFVVPIDDADLAPGRVVELFELMRTLWHPRVGYLLTGDTELFERVFTTHFRSQIELLRLAAPEMLGGGTVRLEPDESRDVERLAHDLYHKAVPVAQRLRLAPMHPAQRLAFLKDSLARATGVGKLIDYLGVDDLSALALPGRWRELFDLRQRIDDGEFQGSIGTKRLASMLWTRAIDQSEFVKYELTSLRKLSRVDELRQSINLPPPSFIQVEPLGTPFRQEPCDVGSISINARFVYEGTFNASGKPDIIHQSSRLDDTLVAAWLLLNNVEREQSAVAPSASESAFRCQLAEVSFTYHTTPGRTSNPSIPTVPLIIRWPIPSWRQQLPMQHLYAQWDSRVAGASRIADIARAFLSLVLEIDGREPAGEMSWSAIAAAVVAASMQAPSEVADWSRGRAGLLASPESGLAPTDANNWLNELKREAERLDVWRTFKESLQSERHERFRLAIDEATTSREEAKRSSFPTVTPFEPGSARPAAHSDGVVRQVDAQSPGYAWKTLVETDSP